MKNNKKSKNRNRMKQQLQKYNLSTEEEKQEND